MSNAYRAVVQAGGGAAVGDATAADVLTGKTFSGAVGSGVSGTMPNNGAVSQTVAGGQTYTIPAGYHNGSGTVTGTGITFNSLSTRLAGGNAKLVFTKSELTALGATSITLNVPSGAGSAYLYSASSVTDTGTRITQAAGNTPETVQLSNISTDYLYVLLSDSGDNIGDVTIQ